MSKPILDPSLSPSGRGIYLATNGVLFVTSRCHNALMVRVPTDDPWERGNQWQCWECDGDITDNYFEASVDVSVQPEHEGKKLDWDLGRWAESWTGLAGAEINIDYM